MQADVVQIDKRLEDHIQAVRNSTPQSFDQNFSGLRFKCARFDYKREVEVIPGGEDIPVTWANRDEYIAAVISQRCSEVRPQVEAMIRGVATVVPVAALSLLTAPELEVAMCGRAEVPVDLLRENTEYSEGYAGGLLFAVTARRACSLPLVR